jgi:hypothetical protein
VAGEEAEAAHRAAEAGEEDRPDSTGVDHRDSTGLTHRAAEEAHRMAEAEVVRRPGSTKVEHPFLGETTSWKRAW